MSEARRRRAGEPAPGSRLANGLGIAWDAIMGNRARSTLTVLGVAVGVSVVMAIAALITGLRSSVMEAFESAGPNNFVVTRFDFTAVRVADDRSGRPPWWNTPEIEPAEARRLGSLATVDEALYNFSFNASFAFEGQQVENVQSQAYSAGWPRYQPGDFVVGRDFTPAEVSQNRALVVLSADLAFELFGQRDPLGRFVRVSAGSEGHQESFEVVGVFEATENIFTAAAPYWAIFPWTAADRRLRQSRWQAQVLVVPNDSIGMTRAQDDVISSLRSMRGLGPRDENDFALIASAQIVDLFDRLTGVFFLVILLLASAGLLVGGVGVIGIMLISVTERTREIGIRKAVGATRREIMWQFLAEASLLTLAGAAVGMLVGWSLAATVAAWTPLPASIPVWAVLASLAMAIVTGMVFGLVPAYRASRLNPVDALRFE